MKKYFQFWAIISLLVMSSCAHLKQDYTAEKSEQQNAFSLNTPLPFDTTIIKGQLPSGLTYLIKQNARPEKRLFLRLVVKIGSVVEEDNEQGIAHFCEHMAFNGTKHFKKQELIDFLESIGMRFGADLNAYTSFDQTVYMLEVPTDSLPLIRQAFQIVEDWAHNVLYDPQEIDRERGVVIEEWRRGRGAYQRVRDQFLPVLFKDSRYAKRLPIGKKEILETFPHEVPLNFYKKWYRPELMAVIVVGDFDPQTLKDLMLEHFSNLQNPPNAPERVYYPVPPQNQTIFSLAKDPELPVAQIEIDYKRDPDTARVVADYRKSLMESMISQMLSKRLQEYTSRPNPPFNYAYSSMMRLVQTKEIFTIACAARSEDILSGYKTLLIEARRALEHGFTPSELERQKKSILSYLKKAFNERDKQNSKKLIEEYTRHVLYMESVPGIEKEFEIVKQILPGISLAEINRLTGELLQNPDRVIAVMGPDKEGVYFPTEDTLKTILAAVDTMKIAPYVDQKIAKQLVNKQITPGSVVKEINHSDIGVIEWRLSNGARILLKPTDFKNDEILMNGFSFGGYSLAPDSIYDSARFSSAIASASGLGKFNRIQLRKFLAGKVVRLNAGISKDTEEFNGSSSVKDFESLLQMVYLNFVSPRFDSTAFQSLIARQKSWLKNKELDPEAVYNDSLIVWLTQRHPRYLPVNEQTLSRIRLKPAADFYRQRFDNPGDFTFIFVGSFKPETIRPLLETYIGGIPGHEEREKWGAQDYTPPDQVVEKRLYRGVDPKSVNTIIFSGPFNWSFENVRKGLFMADILEIKLRERIREAESGTYSIGVRGKFYHIPRQRYELLIRFSCDPKRVEELTADVFQQIDSLLQFGPQEKDLQKVREMYLKDYEEGLKQNGFWRSRLHYSLFHQIPFDHVLRMDDIYRSITLQDVHQMAKELLNKKRYLRAVLLPEKLN
ncbi:M16 family metallopeptidase [Calditrichota bacterium LG25]